MKKILSILCIIVFICGFSAGCQGLSDYYVSNKLDVKCDKVIDCFIKTALYSKYIGDNDTVKRWEQSPNIKLAGDYTQEDYNTLKNYVDTLNDLNELPKIYFADEITTLYDNIPNFYIYFVPLKEMGEYDFLENEDRIGSVALDLLYNEIEISYIGIANDVTTQEDRNNLILHYVTAGLGLMNDSDEYPDSILYSGSTKVQKLSDMDYELIRLLYSDSIRPGMDKNQVKDVLEPLLKAKYLQEKNIEQSN